MTIEQLLERRLIFIAGKGGVGKSTIAAALALAAARNGVKVCLVESDGQEQMARLFQTEPVGHEGGSLAPNVRGISITSEGTLKEFVARRLPFHHISVRLINNRLVRYFLDATPGLKELLVLGKVVDLASSGHDELIIVDLPATGHGLAMLNVPDVVISAVHAGPLRNHAEETRAVINDPLMSAICFVTLAEELAANETIEIYTSIKSTMEIAIGPVIANGVHLPPFPARRLKEFAALKRRWSKRAETALLIDGAELALSRAELNGAYVDKLKATFGSPPIVVPFLFHESINLDALTEISDALHHGGAA